ncbi:RNA-binding protein 43 [Erinaceus europaeus]|uniref:RNA-binding protein 43 n=1 Tax=Erinaceus europaeus TaxID=9365 RepID=A0A1S3WGR5_ERIEU|nr:RNA-binding protein 43 [Erinaceus europaeus]
MYPTKAKGVAYIIFKEKKAAENIARKKKLCLAKKFGSIQLTVCPFTTEVFPSVHAVLDLSVFRSHCSLESLVRDLQKIPALVCSVLDHHGRIAVRGSFLAFETLKESLLLKTHSLLEENRSLVKESKKSSGQNSNKSLQRSSNYVGTLRSSVPKTVSSGETLVLDTDVFLYLKNKSPFYEHTLKKFHVRCQERMEGGISTIHIKNTHEGSRHNHAKRVKGFLEGVSVTLHSQLRKERLVLEGKESSEKRKIKLACEQLCLKYDRVLVNRSRTHIDIIGSSSDIYLFKNDVLKLAGLEPR